MNLNKKQIEFIKNASDHVDMLCGGRGYGKTHQLIKEMEDKINKLQKENKKLKKQKEDVVEYIKSNCIVSDEWTELDFCNFVPTGEVNYKALNKEKVKDLLRMLGEIE